MIFNHNDYREILSSIYSMRAELNPRYSLNAFARNLGLYPSHLNEILRKKKGLSKEKAKAISKALHLEGREKEYFLELIESEHGKRKIDRLASQKRIKQIRNQKITTLNLNSFYVIKDWYHLAIVRYLDLKKQTNNITEMASYFGISYAKAHTAMQRLIQLNLVKKTPRGYEIESDKWYVSPFTIPSECKRIHHKQLIEKAINSLIQHKAEDRDIQSSIIKVNKKKLEKVRPIIEKFHQDLSRALNEDCKDRVSISSDQETPIESTDEVYSFCTQLFSLKEEDENDLPIL